VYPFITRANTLIGIDAVEATPATRERVWHALGAIAHLVDFSTFVDREIPLYELGDALEHVRDGATRGRVLVRLSD
jgi:hypothetical protein